MEGVPKARIAARLGISRTTVVKAVQSDSPPRYQRKPASSSFSPVEARVRQLLEDNPELPAAVLAERVEWTGSMSWFRQNVKRLRPDHRRIDPADRLTWVPEMLRSAICGSRRGRSRWRTARCSCCRCW